MLDSNIIIAIGLASGEAIRRTMARYDEGDFVMSSIAYAEIVQGSMRGLPPPPHLLDALIEEVPILPFGEEAARTYATLPFKRASYDRLIAAHALSLDVTLVTGNDKHFADVPGLRVETWAA